MAAWQREPGRPYGVAIRRTILRDEQRRRHGGSSLFVVCSGFWRIDDQPRALSRMRQKRTDVIRWYSGRLLRVDDVVSKW